MSNKAIHQETRRRLSMGAFVFALFISLAALPGYAQEIHQLSYNNLIWADQGLGGVTPVGGDQGLTAFATTPNDQSHVYYLTGGSSGHVHQLFFNGSTWGDSDLTALSGGPAAAGNVTGFSVGNYQYVYYFNQKGAQHLHQLLYNNVRWVDSDLTVLSKAKVTVNSTGGLVAFTTSPALHVYYKQLGGIGDIHQIYSTNGTTWQDQDLTTLTGGKQPNYLWSGFNIANFQYVYFQGDNLDLHQLLYNNATWTDTDLTVLSKAPQPLISPIAAMVVPGTKKIRLFFRGNDTGHIWQLSSTGGAKWIGSDLTKKTKGPATDPSSSIVAFATTPNNEIHVFYTSGNHINQLFQPTPTSWSNSDLTLSGNGPAVENFTPLSGFSVQNLQYVFYVAQ
jgi:Fungal fucose-specific lectin